MGEKERNVRSKDRVEKGPAEGLECALFAYQKKRKGVCDIWGWGGESTVLFMRVHMESNEKETNISNIPQWTITTFRRSRAGLYHCTL